jgi:hypothetical protein
MDRINQWINFLGAGYHVGTVQKRQGSRAAEGN